MSPTSLTQAQLMTAIRIWAGAFFVTLVVVVLCYKQLDVPLARVLEPYSHRYEALGTKLGSPTLLTLEALAFLVLSIARIFTGKIAPLGRATAVACIASMCAYVINANVLKVIFGIVPTAAVLAGEPHSLHWFAGNPDMSFPSGHMALSGAFLGAYIRLYPKWTTTFGVMLAGIAALLVLGNWHFLSDVIAGTFVGVTAGLLAAEIWIVVERGRAEF